MNKSDVYFFSPTDLSEKSFKELLPDFFSEVLFDFNAIKEKRETMDHKEIRQLAHKIKGVSLSYGAHLISKWAFETQTCIDTNDLKYLDFNIGQLSNAIDQTHDCAKQSILV